MKQHRRYFLREVATLALTGMASALTGIPAVAAERFLRRCFRELSESEIEILLKRIEEEYRETRGTEISVRADRPLEGVVFGYGLDLSRCIGCRRCVYACVHENNQSRDPQIHWIRVLRMRKEKGIDLAESDPYYHPDTVPEDGFFYIPVACQQCRKPPCTKVCPVQATWQEDDGIVVVDYDWCIGCRCCISACPYGARHFNWGRPSVDPAALNRNTHYLGNRPRMVGVVEKCTFCIQKVRRGRYPACVEICPVGARKFGNLLDESGEMQYLLREKRVFVLKEDLNTQPKFYYFYAT